MEERSQISLHICELLAKGAIAPCLPVKNQFVSNIFLRPKPNGSSRLIVNLRRLNEFIQCEHFKIEDRKTVIQLMSPGAFMATIDLTDAYYLIPLDEADRKYVRFRFENKFFEFTCLPFGLCTAPYVFTKLMKPIVTYLRQQGFLSVVYIDDFLLLGDSHEECLRNVLETLKILEGTGFIVNGEKSVLVPSQRVQYLGFIFDSAKWTVELPKSKKESLKYQINRISVRNKCKIRDFAEFLGKLTSSCFAINYAWGYTKAFEREKFLALAENGGNYENYMRLPKDLTDDFAWWKNTIRDACNPIKDSTFAMEIFSDASLTGWGAFCGGERARGHWTENERHSHINYLELLAAFFGLKCFAENMSNCQILLRIDNTTAISYINKMGSIQFKHLNRIARQIWQWCESKNIWVFASYVSSKMNVEADEESRALEPETEFELSDTAFREIVNNYGEPDIDLFATRSNTKCEKYVSWRRDPGSCAVDAFTISWRPYFFYAFPPFSIISRTLQKIKQEKSQGIIVVPDWPSQPWYPMIQTLALSKPLLFKPNAQLILSNNREPHPIWRHISLVAVNLSGERSKGREPQLQRRT